MPTPTPMPASAPTLRPDEVPESLLGGPDAGAVAPVEVVVDVPVGGGDAEEWEEDGFSADVLVMLK